MPRSKLFEEEEVLGRAMMTFWRKGFHATSVEDLVRVTGINRASLYDTFGGKKTLFDRTFETYRKINIDRLSAFLREQSGVKDGLRMLFSSIIEDDCADADRKGCFIANSSAELLPDDKELRDVIAQHRKDVEQILLQFLKEGRKNGSVSASLDLESYASLLNTFMNGLRIVGKSGPPKNESLASVEVILSILDK